MTTLRAAHFYLFRGPGHRLVLLALAAFVSLLGWCAGYLATLELSPFRMMVIVLGMAAVPVIMVHSSMLLPIFMGVLWARVSDVAVATQGIPSIATPVAALLLAWSLIRKVMNGEQISLKTFGDMALALPYVIVVTLSALWSTVPARAFDRSTALIKDIVIFWMFADGLRDRRVLSRAAEAMVIAAAALCVPSLHQYFTNNFEYNYFGFAQSAVLNIVGDFDSYRLGGPVNSPNYFAMILAVTVPVGIALVRTSLPAFERLALAALLAPICLTVLLTFSRGGSVLLALLVLLSFRRTKIGVPQILLGILALAAVLMLTPARVWDRLGTLTAPITGSGEENRVIDDSVDLRIGAQGTAIEMFLSHPFLGVGAGNFPPLYQEYSRYLGLRTQSAEYTPHNLYLETLAETGIVGLVTFLITTIVPLATLWQARRTWPVGTREGHDHLELSYGIELALIGWLVGGTFEQGAFPRYYWLLLAMVIGAAHVTFSANRTGVASLSPAEIAPASAAV